ncbi:MAG: DUF2162 family putative transporter [Synergistaceae bacterium]|jgi:predicted transporter|nr:DUF2162 family putative transporter [Synergistaceae bacterium]
MEFKTLTLGMFVSMASFSVKAGLGWGYLLSRRERAGKIAASAFLAGAYALLFAAAGLVAPRFASDYELFLPLWREGVTLHWAAALLILTWGAALLKSGDGHGSRAWFALVVPCPVCAGAVLASASCLTLYFPEQATPALVGLYAAFMMVAAVTAAVMSRDGGVGKKRATASLGTAMVLISAYFMLSALVAPHFPEARRVYRIAANAGTASALLQSALYLISSSMLYPAMFLLVAGFAAVTASAGATVAEWARRHGAGRTEPEMAELERLDEILIRPGVSWDDVETLWRAIRLKRWKKLDHLRVLTRLSPAMGLVGTLIPMSTGLASLSQGDVSRLSSDLVIAFSTTVVGLCSGVAAYALYTVRSRWLEEDLQALQVAMEARASQIAGSK